MHPASPALVLAALAGFGVVHSLLASLGLKRRLRAWWGQRLADGLYRLVYNALAVITFAPAPALAALLPDRALYALPWPALLVTVPLQAAALAGIALSLIRVDLPRFLGLRQLLRLLRGEAEPRDAPQLVTTGVHAWVRHPLYTFSLVILWLAPAMTLNLLALNVGITLYFWIGSIYEERKLVAEFGEAYRLHQRRTPRFVPRLRRARRE